MPSLPDLYVQVQVTFAPTCARTGVGDVDVMTTSTFVETIRVSA